MDALISVVQVFVLLRNQYYQTFHHLMWFSHFTKCIRCEDLLFSNGNQGHTVTMVTLAMTCVMAPSNYGITDIQHLSGHTK